VFFLFYFKQYIFNNTLICIIKYVLFRMKYLVFYFILNNIYLIIHINVLFFLKNLNN